MNLKRELRVALRREEPPEGFAERVLARAAQRTEAPVVSPWWRFPWMPLVSVTACAALVVLAGAGYREWQGQMARQRTLEALAFAGGELHTTQLRVRHILAARAGERGRNPGMEMQ